MKRTLHLLVTFLVMGCFTFSFASNNFSETSPSGKILVTDIGAEVISSSFSAGTLIVSIASTDATCDLANGEATASVSGGSGTITYSWSNSTSGATATNLAAGVYSVTATDVTTGCTGFESVEIFTTPGITVTASATATTCGQDDGTASASASGGSGTYTYSWSNGDTGANISGLDAGSYTVTADDGNGCTATETVMVDSSSGVTVTASATATTCGQDDGTATASASGGSGTYTYSWSNGDTGANISGLAAGSYTVTATDGTCTATETVMVGSSSGITVTASATDEVCGGDGTASASASGGSGTYTYSWSNGDTGANISGLGAGSYTVTADDGNGCNATETVSVSTNSSPLSVAVSATDEVCTAGDGTATATPTNADGTVTYAWSNGGSTATITGLSAGVYDVTVTDQSCSVTGSVEVFDDQSNCGATYCDSEGQSTEYEWIKRVKLKNINNTSGDDGGYGDYTSLVANDFKQGQWKQILLKPGFSGYAYREYWKVWVDWNQDGDFDDAGELEGYGSGFGTMIGWVSAPHNAAVGETRMRVSMKYGWYAHSCETFGYGEVEDYTIQVTSSGYVAGNTSDGGGEMDSNELAADQIAITQEVARGNSREEVAIGFTPASVTPTVATGQFEVSVYPNPVKDVLNVEYQLETEGAATIQIFNITGKLLVEQQLDNVTTFQEQTTIDVSQFQSGAYFVRMSNGQDSKTVKFIKH